MHIVGHLLIEFMNSETENERLPQKTKEEYLAFAREIVASARQLILPLWHENKYKGELKENNTPVTEVDLKAEELLRDLITAKFPNHGIIGEEYGALNPNSEFQWIIDP